MNEHYSEGVQKVGPKYKKYMEERKLHGRHYKAQHFGNTDVDANAEIPLPNTKYIAVGFPDKEHDEDNHHGIGSFHQFYACPELGVGLAAARRMPCACAPCNNQIRLPWVWSRSPRNQPRFQSTPDCKYHSSFEDRNEWVIIAFKEDNKCFEEEEVQELREEVLDNVELQHSQQVRIGGHGAYQIWEGVEQEGRPYYVVEWTSESFSLVDDSTEVEGMNGGVLERGNLVAWGKYLYRVPTTARWYTHEQDESQEYLFRLRWCAGTNVRMVPPGQEADVASVNDSTIRNDMLEKRPVMMMPDAVEKIDLELARKAKWDYDEMVVLATAAAEEAVGLQH
jgi:hypothetical protein